MADVFVSGIPHRSALPQSNARTYEPERFVQRPQLILRTGEAETYIRRGPALHHLPGPEACKSSNVHGHGHVRDTTHCQGGGKGDNNLVFSTILLDSVFSQLELLTSSKAP